MADISLKFGVQGDKNMKSALAAINSEIKGLDAEMKLAVAQMANMDDSEEKNAKTSAILEKQYKANAEKVELLSKRYKDSKSSLDALEKELDEAKKTTGENSEEVQKLQNAYNKQKKATTDLGTELTKAQTKMQNAKNSMDSLGKETNETSGELEKGSKSVSSFGDMLKAKLTGEAIIAAVKKLAQGLKELAVGAVNLSDQLATQAQVTGLSTDALQEYNYMAELIDVSVDTITGSMTKLTRNMQSAQNGTGAAADAFRQLNVRVTNLDGSLRSNQDVFDDVIDALGNVANETERDAIAMNIFGKSAQELNPLINAGSDQIRKYAKEAHDMGYVMSEDVIKKNVQASDAYERMKNSITAAKNYVGSQFAPVIEKAAGIVQKLVQAARDNESVIKKVISVLAGAVAGFVAYKAAVAAASAATALMAANPVTLCIAALTALVTAAALASKTDIQLSDSTKKLISDMDKLSAEIDESANALKTLEDAKKKNISGANSEAKYYTDLAKELDTIVDKNGKVKKGYEDRAKVITGTLSNALGIEIQLTGDQIKNYQQIQTEIYNVIAAKKAEAILKAQEAAYTEAVTNRASAEFGLIQAVQGRKNAEKELGDNQKKIKALEQEYQTIAASGIRVMTDRQHAILNEIDALKQEQPALTQNINNANTKVKEAQNTVATYAYNITQYEKNLSLAHSQEFGKMNTVTWELVKAYQSATKEEKAALDAQYGNLLAEASRDYAAANSIGKNIINGIRDGVNNKAAQQAAYGAVQSFSSNLLATSRRTLQIQSPSKATAEMGRYLMEGFSVGIDDGENGVIKQVQQASSSILGAFGGTPAGVTTVGGAPAIQSAGGTYVIQLMLDGKQIATSTTNIQAQRQRAYAL